MTPSFLKKRTPQLVSIEYGTLDWRLFNVPSRYSRSCGQLGLLPIKALSMPFFYRVTPAVTRGLEFFGFIRRTVLFGQILPQKLSTGPWAINRHKTSSQLICKSHIFPMYSLQKWDSKVSSSKVYGPGTWRPAFGLLEWKGLNLCFRVKDYIPSFRQFRPNYRYTASMGRGEYMLEGWDS